VEVAVKGTLKIIKGSLSVHHAVYGFSLWGRDPDSMEMVCLGEMDDRAPEESYRKIGGGYVEPYDPNSDHTLRKDFDFMVVDAEVPEEFARAFVNYQD
jgi:hypothetical protein